MCEGVASFLLDVYVKCERREIIEENIIKTTFAKEEAGGPRLN